MVTGKMPVCDAPFFAGSSIANALTQIHGNNNTNTANKSQTKLENNLILFRLPAYKLPKKHKIPSTIAGLMNEFNLSYFKDKVVDLFNRHPVTERLIRAEFRETVAILRAACMQYYDVVREEIGYYTDKGHWKLLSYKKLAEKTGIALLTVKRIFKALKMCNHVTIINGERKKDKVTGKWHSNIARKIINPSFFLETLGKKSWNKIQALKEWKLRRPEKQKRITPEQKKNLGLLKRMLGGIGNSSSTSNAVTPDQRLENTRKLTEDSANRERALLQKAKALYDRDPSRSLMDYLKEIKQSTA